MIGDIFSKINDAVLDLQGAQYQTYEQPLKKLARLLADPDLRAANETLTASVDLEAFLAASKRTESGMAGSHKLAWPDDDEQCLGLTLLLIGKLAADPSYAINFGHYFFGGSSSKLISGIHGFTGQIVVPFVRDYKEYVMSKGERPQNRSLSPNKVFIVHGHDDAALNGLARFIERLGLTAIILKEQPDRGRTIIEKFEDSAGDVGFAVVLLTPDDVGGAVREGSTDARARQNVIFELGYFSGRLGRGRVCLLRKGEVEIPSDLFGVIYTEMDPAEGWKTKLVRELKAAKLEFDADKLWQ